MPVKYTEKHRLRLRDYYNKLLHRFLTDYRQVNIVCPTAFAERGVHFVTPRCQEYDKKGATETDTPGHMNMWFLLSVSLTLRKSCQTRLCVTDCILAFCHSESQTDVGRSHNTNTHTHILSYKTLWKSKSAALVTYSKQALLSDTRFLKSVNSWRTSGRTHAHTHTVVFDVTTQKHEGTCAGWQTCFFWRSHCSKVSLAFAVSSSAYASDCWAHCNMLQPYWWHISVTSRHSALGGWAASSNTDVTPLTPSNGSGQSERSQFQFPAWYYKR